MGVEIFERHLEPRIHEALRNFRVVVVHGARQSGKTTLAKKVAEERGGSYATLDDELIRMAALEDPHTFLRQQRYPMVIDEIQLGGDRLVRAVKIAVDEEPTKGRFLLTGSADFLSVPTISESLAGRAAILRLWPLSVAEICSAVNGGLISQRWPILTAKEALDIEHSAASGGLAGLSTDNDLRAALDVDHSAAPRELDCEGKSKQGETEMAAKTDKNKSGLNNGGKSKQSEGKVANIGHTASGGLDREGKPKQGEEWVAEKSNIASGGMVCEGKTKQGGGWGGGRIGGLFGWFEGKVALNGASQMNRSDYLELACVGGYPEVLALEPSARRMWLESYVETVLSRDIAEIADVRRLATLRSVLQLAATRTSGELNIANWSRWLNVDRNTLEAYLGWLRMVFLAYELPAWTRNLSARVVRRPKLFISDTGLLAALTNIGPDALQQPNSVAVGALLETFVANEITRQIAASGALLRLHHFRESGAREVDLVIERADGGVVAVEVKASASPSADHLKHLVWMRDRLDKVSEGTFKAGLLLHTGTQGFKVGDRLFSVPIDTLWRPY